MSCVPSAVIVSSPGKIPRVKEIPVPLEPRPRQAASSKDRRGGREDHGSQASSRASPEEGAPEANGHARTAGSHGSDTSQGAIMVRKQGSRSGPDGGAAKDGFSAESRHPGKEALQSGISDRCLSQTPCYLHFGLLLSIYLTQAFAALSCSTS